MSKTIRVIVKSDKDDATIAEQKLIKKGYTVSVSEAKTIVLDIAGLGGQNGNLSDPDGKAFFIFGTK